MKGDDEVWFEERSKGASGVSAVVAQCRVVRREQTGVGGHADHQHPVIGHEGTYLLTDELVVVEYVLEHIESHYHLGSMRGRVGSAADTDGQRLGEIGSRVVRIPALDRRPITEAGQQLCREPSVAGTHVDDRRSPRRCVFDHQPPEEAETSDLPRVPKLLRAPLA